MLRQFTRQEETDGCLNFPTGDGASLVVVCETGRFGGDAFEDVVDEGIHDGHGLAGNSSVGVDLLQNFVDVDGERFLPSLLPLLLVSSPHGFLGLAGLLNGFTACLRWHFERGAYCLRDSMRVSQKLETLVLAKIRSCRLDQ